MYLTADV